jgi:hypothetical protein
MMVIDNKYSIGETVYLTTDDEQKKRVVTAITVRTLGVIYELSCGVAVSNHYDFEMSAEEDIEMKVK